MLAALSLFLLVASGLPAFYRALLRAWTALHGFLSQTGLIVDSADTALLRAESLTCKSCYQLILSLNPVQPHCVVKFRSNYGDLDWDYTWKTLFVIPLDGKPIDLCWKVAHGVLYTAHRLFSFGLNVPPDCLCGQSDETLEHLFFHCPLAQSDLDWSQSLLFPSSSLAPAITARHVLFGFSSDELLCVPRVFCYLLSLLKFLARVKGMTIVFGPNLQVPWALSLVSRVACPSIYLCFLNVFCLGPGAVSSNANGEQMAESVRSLVTLFISFFLSVVRVCFPRSALLAVLW